MAININTFIKKIHDFDQLAQYEQIKYVAYYLLRHQGQEVFSPAEIKQCFIQAGYAPPGFLSGTIYQYSTSSYNEAPFIHIKRGKYRLSQPVANEIDGVLQSSVKGPVGHKGLEKLAKLSTNTPQQKKFLNEASVCYAHKAFRACAIMAWLYTLDLLINRIINNDLAGFNIKLGKNAQYLPNQTVQGRDDFEYLREHAIIQTARKAGIISMTVAQHLDDLRKKRNMWAHPSGTVVKQPIVRSFLLDLIENVINKIQS